MYIATHTITRYLDGVGKVTFVKGREYNDGQMAAFPNWYKQYTVESA